MAGRPKKEVSDARANVLRIRLSAAEREELDAAAARRILDTSTWARSELLALARKATAESKSHPGRMTTG